MALDFACHKTVRGADQMEHFHGFMIGGEARAGGKDHNQHGCGADQGQNTDGEKRGRACRSDKLSEPLSVRVQFDPRCGGGKTFCQTRHVDHGIIRQRNVHQSGEWQVFAGLCFTQPRIQEIAHVAF